MKNELRHVRNDLFDKKALLQDKKYRLQECERSMKKLEKTAEDKRRAHKSIVDEKEALINDLKKKIAKRNGKTIEKNQVCSRSVNFSHSHWRIHGWGRVIGMCAPTNSSHFHAVIGKNLANNRFSSTPGSATDRGKNMTLSPINKSNFVC